MTKTGIIGHRGAAGLALENSPNSIRAALDYDIDAIEFDIHRTRDGKLVVLHDSHTGRIAEKRVLVHMKTLAELQALKLKNGQQLPTLEELFQLIGNKKTVVIDIKDLGCTEELLRLLAAYPEVSAECTSLKYSELAKLHKARPDLPLFVRDLLNPFEILHTARQLGAKGISLNMWLMNPLTFWLAKRRNLELRIYTVNNARLGRFFRTLYPDIVIYTNHPERFVSSSKG
ncbi:MAG TPA: glycerophosphodiester phosphodiesterase family protein [Candidatus Saccharimonadales bacterium]